MHGNNRVVSLKLVGSEIDDCGAGEIAQALCSLNNRLQRLDLGKNSCGYNCAQEFAVSLRSEHNCLLSLNFGNNEMEFKGSLLLGSALEK